MVCGSVSGGFYPETKMLAFNIDSIQRCVPDNLAVLLI